MRALIQKKSLFLLAAILFILLYALVLRVQLGNCARLGAEVSSLQHQLAEARDRAGSLGAEERALAVARNELSRHQTALSGHPDSGLYLTALGEEARAAGVAVSEFIVGASKDLPTCRESAVQLVVTGEYLRVLDFLQRVLEPGQAELEELHIIDATLAPVAGSGQGQFPGGPGPEGGVVVARLNLKVFSAPGDKPVLPAIPPAQLPLGRPNLFIEAIPLTPAENVKKLPPLAGTA